MGQVVSLTEEAIEVRLEAWADIDAVQEALNAKIAELNEKLETAQAMLANFEDNVVPALQEQLAQGWTVVGDIRDNDFPALETAVVRNADDINDIRTVSLIAIESSLESNSLAIADIPVTFRQDEPPEDIDEDRPLMAGDKWYDTNNNNAEYHWDGTAWVESNISIPDFSLTVQKFKVGTHQIY